MSDEPARPTLQVVRGAPDDADLAALVAVLSARAATGPGAAPPPSAWNDHGRALRRDGGHGPGAWRASAWP